MTTNVCKCEESKKPIDKRRWRVHDRHSIWSKKSVDCARCGAMWRTKARYVDKLPDYKSRETPYRQGRGAAATRLACLERYSAAPPDDCPFAKGTKEERDYDRGWKEYMKETPH
jgi:hypothetical protein